MLENKIYKNKNGMLVPNKQCTMGWTTTGTSIMVTKTE